MVLAGLRGVHGCLWCWARLFLLPQVGFGHLKDAGPLTPVPRLMAIFFLGLSGASPACSRVFLHLLGWAQLR